MSNYILTVAPYKGKKEHFTLEAENIVDIKDALQIASKYEELAINYPGVWRAIYGELPPHFGECMSDTIRRISEIPVPTFNY